MGPACAEERKRKGQWRRPVEEQGEIIGRAIQAGDAADPFHLDPALPGHKLP